jgi:hypothetical protein
MRPVCLPCVYGYSHWPLNRLLSSLCFPPHRCVELLRDSLEHHNLDTLHTKLAHVYTLNEQ